MKAAVSVVRFDEADHAYYLDDVRIPSVTQLIEAGGLLKGAEYFTQASRDRGHEVHRLCMELDLGVLDVGGLSSPVKGYILAYEAARKALRPSWEAIEVAEVHPGFRFAGRPDRLGRVLGRRSVVELKTGGRAAHHPVQTALQALLAEARGLPAVEWERLTVYLKPGGKFSVDAHTDRRDFDVAHDLIRRFCR